MRIQIDSILYKKLFKVILGLEILLYTIHFLCVLKLPAIVPLHWNNMGEADAYGTKWIYLMCDLLPFFVLWLFYLPFRSPHPPLYLLSTFWLVFSVFMSLFTAVATWIPEYMIYSIQTPLEKIHVIEKSGLIWFGLGLIALGFLELYFTAKDVSKRKKQAIKVYLYSMLCIAGGVFFILYFVI